MKVIAHRGASAEKSQNTMAAFERALEIGVDAIEMDLLLTREGELVVRHDNLIKMDGTVRQIGEMSLEEIAKFDVGTGERMPTLEAVFDRFHKKIPLVLDLKAWGIAAPLAKFLIKRSAAQEIHLTSFLHAEISELSSLCPRVDRSVVMVAIPIPFESVFEAAQVRQVSLNRSTINEAVIHRLHEAKIQVWSYTVNWLEEAQRFKDWGMDGIFTDDPALMQPLRSPVNP